jgi:hypothetical protein
VAKIAALRANPLNEKVRNCFFMETPTKRNGDSVQRFELNG